MNLKKIGKVFTSKFVGTGPSSYEKRIYRAVVTQRLRNNGLENPGIESRPALVPIEPSVQRGIGSFPR